MIRSLIFNILYYPITAILCFAYLPFLILPRKWLLIMVELYVKIVYVLEKYVLGLDFEIRGAEYLPKDEAFIVAAKHFSSYETLKLHILFKDPAIVIKKELFSIPIWGWYAKKMRLIGIDRSNRDTALKSVTQGAQMAADMKRPIVIFPQGTRVSLDHTVKDKPYKAGIMRMQNASGLKIVPLAMNTGVFWPRNAFIKKGGKVIFEFMPAVETGLSTQEGLAIIQEAVESKTAALIAETSNEDS
ncbi:MAG: lysophospholipid acyltransferase family protein [Pseudomonadota bacterium]|jgi:1-acyl-sn-glycerol-3-phosphate acyltransferase|nr:lysophospholipid acyltransferase family protein [Pseudomonadota bacterium]MEC7701895.1 lysophospholipid acyltransferase family protein [Pseudomonadota bacterium]MEC9236060.1 lysophospholipid acyltransferase family protein [Pseudomonadota bacterium]